MSEPALSYTVWFSQRTGSTWLCQALSSTGIAGRPAELFIAAEPERLVEHYGAGSVSGLLSDLHRRGSTPNGIFGIKQGFVEPRFGEVIALFRHLVPRAEGRLQVWESLFPHHRHVFMTRRNKVRLAVSWWRAIQTGEWHRRYGEPPSDLDLSDGYSFAAIDRLLGEAVLREAGIQELLAESSTVPLTIAYEDLQADFPAAVRGVLSFLGLADDRPPSFTTDLERTADEITESWVQRFRREKQVGWDHAGW